ncbi:MAG: hypothetical protein IPK01_08455 [Acidobacteria bacterium]|nr:hypothetical protein [Acidobacteriota bacterium]
MAACAANPPLFLALMGKISIVISGFNTDIEFDGIVYHVQTEDKGLSSKLIVSLIYDRGTILASKRVSYEDLAEGNFDETAITDRLNRQHKLICAAVKAGRIEDLKSMSRKAVPAAAAASPNVPAIPIAPVSIDKPESEHIAAYTPPDPVDVFPAPSSRQIRHRRSFRRRSSGDL